MNDIPKKQNEQPNLNLLLAQRRLYSVVKAYFTSRTIISLALAFCGPALTAVIPNSGVYVGIVSIVYLLLDELAFQRIEKRKQLQAAKIQELFDSEVLDLPWNLTVVGSKPELELIGGLIENASATDYLSLRDWYSPAVGKVDLPMAKILCQRSNLAWDTILRRRYLTMLIFGLILLVASAVITSAALNLTVVNLVLGVFAPGLPLVKLFIEQIRRQHESKQNTAGLIDKIDPIIDRLCKGSREPQLENKVRVLQDEIFRHRRTLPVIYDWVYWLFRDQQERQMQFSVELKVNEYLKNSKARSAV